jgi:endoglucanase
MCFMVANQKHSGWARRPTHSLLVLGILAVFVAACLCALLPNGARAAGRAPVAHSAATGCASPYPATRDRSNPLDLPVAPGSNPLNGARFTDPGAFGGNYAATAIAQLLGINPESLSPTQSWAQFQQQIESGPQQAKLNADPALAKQVNALAMIASQPQAQRISTYSWGGTPSGIAKQTHKLFCQIAASDPGSVPIISTYFLHPNLGGCATTKQINAYMPRFKAQINAMVRATGRHPAVYLLELDALGSSVCMSRGGSMPAWEAALRYEMHAVQSLPHTVVYIEGGYSDSNSVGYTAKALKALHVNRIRGFFTNDTHNQWTSTTVAWASKVAKRTGSHFIVNTSDNGQGPKLNPHPTTQGVEDTCNPLGRGPGIEDTTATGFHFADAFLWTHPPGMSGGSCNGGPSSGTFFTAMAEGEATRANSQLGPGYPSSPYGLPTL